MRRVQAAMFAVGLALAGSGAGDLGAGGDGSGDNGDLDPLNPPDSPFGDNPFPDDGTCGDVNVVVSGITPTVQLLIDQSGSMDEDFAGGNRWNAVYSTLMGADGVVPTLQTDVRFGLTLYTSFDGNNGGQCPVLTEVDPALDNYDAMNQRFAPAGPESDTPTGESILATANRLKSLQADGPKIIVLGTDGEPDTCEEPNPQNGQGESIAAAQQAFNDGIRTFVISVGDEVGEDHLQDMANAGVGLPIGGTENAEYFVALNPQELVNAFRSIVGGVQGCVFTMNGEVDPAKAAQGLVALDGNALEFGTDWRLLDSKTFEILGASCDTIQDGDLHHVSAAFPCGVVVVD